MELLAIWVVCYLNLNIITHTEHDFYTWEVEEQGIHWIFINLTIFLSCPALLAWAIYEEYIEKDKQD